MRYINLRLTYLLTYVGVSDTHTGHDIHGLAVVHAPGRHLQTVEAATENISV